MIKLLNTLKSVENDRFIIGLYEGADSKYYIGWATMHTPTQIGAGLRDLATACHIFDQKLVELEMN